MSRQWRVTFLTGLRCIYLSSSSGLGRILCWTAVALRKRFTCWQTSFSDSMDETLWFSLGFSASGGGNSIGFSSNFNLLRLGISPSASGSRVILFFAMARNFRELMFLISSGIATMLFLLMSKISSDESWRTCHPLVDASDSALQLGHAYRLRKVLELVPSYVEISQSTALHNFTRHRYLWVVRKRKPASLSAGRCIKPLHSSLPLPFHLVPNQCDDFYWQGVEVLVAKV